MGFTEIDEPSRVIGATEFATVKNAGVEKERNMRVENAGRNRKD